MSSVNKVTLIGRIGKDPEVKTFTNGGKIVELTLATSEKYKNREGKEVENTEWHNLNTSIPGIVTYLEKFVKKGDMLYVEGRIKYPDYTDANGVKKILTKISISSVQKLSSSGGNSSATANNTSKNTSADNKPSVSSKELNDIASEDDDLPF